MKSTVKLERMLNLKLPTAVLGGSLSPDEKSVVAACTDGVYRQPLNAEGKAEKLYSHESYVSSAHWLSDELIISAGYDGNVRWFDPRSKTVTHDLGLHQFWSWDMAIDRGQQLLVSVTGQYLAGDYKYRPRPEQEPSVCVVNLQDRTVLHRLPHVPSVQSVAVSPDGKYAAAGNLMGEVRIYELATGSETARLTTDAFTSWGIIKSHCYLGGIFDLEFTPDGNQLLLTGMGPMRDPMAGNGKQLWQKWDWRVADGRLLDQTHDGEAGEGLMETLSVHPSGEFFLIGGRLRGGDWNVAIFELESGSRLASLKTGYRVTEAFFDASGEGLVLLGTQGQPKKKKEGAFPNFGRVEVYGVEIA